MPYRPIYVNVVTIYKNFYLNIRDLNKGHRKCSNRNKHVMEEIKLCCELCYLYIIIEDRR